MHCTVWCNAAVDLKRFLSQLDVAEREAVASACGTTLGHLQNIVYGLRTCSPVLAVTLEKATAGEVTRRDLRPKDWHLIWPELIGPEGAPTPSEKEGA